MLTLFTANWSVIKSNQGLIEITLDLVLHRNVEMVHYGDTAMGMLNRVSRSLNPRMTPRTSPSTEMVRYLEDRQNTQAGSNAPVHDAQEMQTDKLNALELSTYELMYRVFQSTGKSATHFPDNQEPDRISRPKNDNPATLQSTTAM